MQTSTFLRKKGIKIYCVEFKYFETNSGEKLISSNIVVGNDAYKLPKIQTTSLPKINKKIFLDNLNKNGMKVFQKIFEFSNENNLLI